MPTELADTLALLDTVERRSARSYWLDWQAMSALVRILRGLGRASERDPLAEREQYALDRTWAFVRACAEGPLNPGTESAEVRFALSDAIAVARVHSPTLERLRDAVEAVAASEHPAAPWLIDFLTSFTPQELPVNHPRAGQSSVALLARPGAALAIRSWLAFEELDVDVTTPAVARFTRPWECVVLFGPPERYVTNRWTRGDSASARAAWLLTAPPATQVVIVSWSGHARVRSEACRPWSGGPAPQIHHADASAAPVDEWQPPDVSAYPPARPIRHGGSDVVNATGVQVLVGADTTVQCYFAAGVGPHPTVAHANPTGLSVRTGAVHGLRPGTHLLFRLGGTEGAALDEATAAWCRDNRPGSWIANAATYQAQIKCRLTERLYCTSYDTLVRDLVAAGLPRDYSEHLLARVLHPLYIAPQQLDAFNALCRVIGYRPPEDAFAVLTDWRTARRQGGLIVRHRLLDGLRDAAPHSAEVQDIGYTLLDHPELGRVIIGTVIAPVDVPGKIQIGKLGRPLCESGVLWTP